MDRSSNRSDYVGNITDYVEYTSVEMALRSTVVLVVSLAIILSNLLNFVILKTTKHMSPFTRIFLMNLTTADFSTGLIGCLPALGPAITGKWPYGTIWCQASGMITGSCGAVSIWSVGVIGVERYIATRYPLLYKRKFTTRTSVGIICSLWTLGILLLLIPTLTKATSVMYFRFSPAISTCVVYCETKWLCIAMGLMMSVLTGSIVTFTTTSVGKALKQGMPANTGAATSAVREANKRQHTTTARETKAIRLLTVTTGLYFATWGPYSVVYFLEIFELDSHCPDWLVFILMWIAFSNCFVNVIIYSAIYQSFRCRLKRLLYAFFCCGCFRLGARIEPTVSSVSDPSSRHGHQQKAKGK